MSIYIPFNNQPESVTIQTGSYTIPAGKFARVTIQARAWASGFVSPTGTTGLNNLDAAYQLITNDSDSDNITIYLPAGSQLASTTQDASDTDSGVSSTNVLQASGASFVNVTVDSSVVLSVYVSAQCYCKNISSSGSDYVSATVTGGTDVQYTVELFSEIS